MKLISEDRVIDIYNSYPEEIRAKTLLLRQLVIDTAKEIDSLTQLEETLKWGEPSYLTQNGSTIRIAWKPSKPTHYALYFNCKTTLVETFKERYRDDFTFEGNRAIILSIDDEVAIEPLKHCIALSLKYHTIKHLPMLGI